MTQANDPNSELDDDMLPEYDLSQLRRHGKRGRHAESMRQGYSVTIHHEDGTSTTRYMPPSNSADNAMNDKIYNWQGDRINGDKVMGDKVGGDKVAGDKITQYHSQNLTQAAQEIKALLTQLDQDYDRSSPTGQAMISAKAIEKIESNPTLKARVVNALKEGGAAALESAVDHPAVKPVVALLKGFMDAS